MARQHVERARILDDAIGLRRIDLDDVVALRFQSAETHQVFDVLRREQVLAGGQRRVVDAGDLGKQREIERIARLLEPAQLETARVRAHKLSASSRLNLELASTASLPPFGRIDFTASTRCRSSASGMPPTFIFTMV